MKRLFGEKAENFGREILSPAKVAARLQDAFDRDFGLVWVEGEIAELSTPFSGHAYFCLKDRESKLKAVMWKGRRAYAGAALEEGLTALARGRLVVYAPRGEYQLVVDYLEPRGEGALRLAYEKLKARLEAEGLFDEERKRRLPFWPRRVALISSSGGAAARDFIETALALRPGAAISLYPVRVQGEGAALEIAEAIADLNRWGGFDVIVITRGGGSLTDLWAFNEEITARAVGASRIPTLAAIGHSTDLSLTELAADQRAITPTAAAESVFRDQGELTAYLAATESRLWRGLARLLEGGRGRLEALSRRLSTGVAGFSGARRALLDQLAVRLGRFEYRLIRSGQDLDHGLTRLMRAMSDRLAEHRRRLRSAEEAMRLLSPAARLARRAGDLKNLEEALTRAMVRRLTAERQNLSLITAKMSAMSPVEILKRGYALVTLSADGKILRAAREAGPGDAISIRLAEGGLRATIEETYEKD
ncbi:MAG: exodeoxyribonuclease VII large subunit [Candidatus Adiutrix sp.]|jgi:exodeoxyribonuclease VII large subunit|nr:exodeoxyribonuclease VII large subunit [Candidatus Adiutrix sp.]